MAARGVPPDTGESSKWRSGRNFEICDERERASVGETVLIRMMLALSGNAADVSMDDHVV
jgi:hypothetical protein